MPQFHEIGLERLITETEAASLYGVSRDTLRRRTDRGEGPPKIRMSPRRVGYRLRDVLADIRRCEMNAGSRELSVTEEMRRLSTILNAG
jgi:predicted DNA-binding transcriptional regulator AlpA